MHLYDGTAEKQAHPQLLLLLLLLTQEKTRKTRKVWRKKNAIFPVKFLATTVGTGAKPLFLSLAQIFLFSPQTTSTHSLLVASRLSVWRWLSRPQLAFAPLRYKARLARTLRARFMALTEKDKIRKNNYTCMIDPRRTRHNHSFCLCCCC